MNQQCPQCQVPLKPESRFCGKCGAKIEPSKPTITQPPSHEPVPTLTLPSNPDKAILQSVPSQIPVTPNIIPEHSSFIKSTGVALLLIAVLAVIVVVMNSNHPKSAKPVVETLIPIIGTYVHHNGRETKTLTFSAGNLVVSASSHSSETNLLNYERTSDNKPQVVVHSPPSKDGTNSRGEWHQFAVSSDDRILSDASTGAKYVRQGN